MSLDGLQIGRYHLLHLLGSGGMGEVYLANDTPVNRQVAIKVIRSEVSAYPTTESTTEATRLFQREVKAIAGLDHPNILPLYDYGEEVVQGMNTTYMVMPYRSEGTLTTWLSKRGNLGLLTPLDVASIVAQAASGLQYAHDHNVVHQDIKPSNFLIRTREENPQQPMLQLSDFGVAKISSATSNVSQSVRGTPTYMAPEQWEGNALPATDQYALAIMTYELLTGRAPFQGGLGQMMYQHMHVQPPPPSTYSSRVPAEVDEVLLTALAKKPEQRFLSIAAFARAFQQALQHLESPTLYGGQSSTKLAVVSGNMLSQSHMSDVNATLAISEDEARNGTTRTITLSGGQRISVSIPPGTHEGQVIELDDAGKPVSASDTKPSGAIVLTIAVQATDRSVLPDRFNSYDQTIASTPNQPLGRGGRGDTPLPPHAPPPLPITSGVDLNNQPPIYAPPPPLVYGPVAGYSSAVPVYPPAAPVSKPRRFPIGIAIMMVVLAIVLASGGVFLAKAYIDQAITHATPVVSLTPLPTHVATATAVPTTPPTPTPSSTNPYTQSGRLVLNDPLVDNSQGHAWSEGINALHARCYFSNGAYYSSQPNAGYFHSCMGQATDLTNFVLEVQITLLSGDYEGIVFRVNPGNPNQYYYFSVDQKGNYILRRSMDANASDTVIINQGPSSAITIGQNQTNTLAVVANFGNITLYVNQQKVAETSDNNFAHGIIGFLVGNDGTDAVAVAQFRNVRIWQI